MRDTTETLQVTPKVIRQARNTITGGITREGKRIDRGYWRKKLLK